VASGAPTDGSTEKSPGELLESIVPFRLRTLEEASHVGVQAGLAPVISRCLFRGRGLAGTCSFEQRSGSRRIEAGIASFRQSVISPRRSTASVLVDERARHAA
jgi:hypothetical protein